MFYHKVVGDSKSVLQFFLVPLIPKNVSSSIIVTMDGCKLAWKLEMKNACKLRRVLLHLLSGLVAYMRCVFLVLIRLTSA
jgi:hypothetical protein